MADMSVPSLLESLEAHIFRRSMRRRTAPSSRGPVFPDTGFEPNLLPWFRSKRQTAFPPPSSGCHHFHKAPSSDGASFFAYIAVGRASPLGIARPEHKKSPGWPIALLGSLARAQESPGWTSEPPWDRSAGAQSLPEERPSICAWLAFRLRVCRTRRHPA